MENVVMSTPSICLSRIAAVLLVKAGVRAKFAGKIHTILMQYQLMSISVCHQIAKFMMAYYTILSSVVDKTQMRSDSR